MTIDHKHELDQQDFLIKVGHGSSQAVETGRLAQWCWVSSAHPKCCRRDLACNQQPVEATNSSLHSNSQQ